MLMRYDTSVFEVKRLKNSVPVYLQELPVITDESCRIDIVFRGIGSIADPPELPGLAHLYEHMLFLGTRKYPTRTEITRPFLQRGGYVNVVTCLDRMVLYCVIHPDCLETALDILSDMIAAPVLRVEDISAQLNIIGSEYRRVMGNDEDKIRQLFQKKFYGDSPHNHTPLGDITALWRVTQRDLIKFQAQYIHAGNMGIVCTGFFPDPSKLFRLLEKYFGSLDCRMPFAIPPPCMFSGNEIAFMPGISRRASILAYPMRPLTKKERYAINLLKLCLSGDSEALLVQELRHKRGLVYETGELCDFYAGVNHGYFEFYLPVVEGKHMPEAESAAREAIEKLSDSHFQEMKSRVLQNRRMQFVLPTDAAERAVESFILDFEVASFEEEEKEIAAVTWDDVRFRKYFITQTPHFLLRVYSD